VKANQQAMEILVKDQEGKKMHQITIKK
jgi:hypothetical protein